MPTLNNETVVFQGLSLAGANQVVGTTQGLGFVGASYNTWAWSGASASRIAPAAHSTVTALATAVDTLVAELKAKGLIA